MICPLILGGRKAEHCGLRSWGGGGASFVIVRKQEGLGSVFLPPAPPAPSAHSTEDPDIFPPLEVPSPETSPEAC